ncbi:HAMP domain-containing methyl-accepting chemotaxis protein [Nitrincola sp. MINF-07-Sa-05]|uniref:HAMP domain-containing methyl-accepting chemotaxis protein n=1 Tax=Nitrincola salilacus TaxID=3400273 RepID=UPI003918432A
MNYYLNLKTRNKLLLLFGTLAVIMLLLLLQSLQQQKQLQQTQQELYSEAMQPMLLLESLRIDLNERRSRILGHSLRGRLNSADEMVLQSTIGQEVEKMSALQQALVIYPQLQGSVRELQQLHEQFNQTTQSQLLPFLRQGDSQSAQALLLGVQQERIERIRSLAEEISAVVEQKVVQQLERSGEQLNLQGRVMLAGILLILLLMGVATWSLNRTLAASLVELAKSAGMIAEGERISRSSMSLRQDEVGLLSQAFDEMGSYLSDLSLKAQRIAEGDLRDQIQPRSERDQLGHAFANMAQYLTGLADRAQQVAEGDLSVQIQPRSEQDQLGSAFSVMAGNLRQLLSGLNDSIAVLATASQEILSTTGQVVSSAQQTASAVQEITTTVEEVKQTATLASQKARQVTDSAEQTSRITREGRAAVDTVMSGMSDIRQQMQTLSDSIGNLSEQSQAVGEIVNTVGDLAEQSNLLGVNASIEAVKADEHGKGFSVVAQEVRSLAEQSKQATVQVRSILNEIQKAMSKAVLMTEQNSRAVENGYDQARRSGEALLALTERFDQSTNAAMQIAASSQQQLVGMDQVAMAMQDINNASQNNVAGARQAEQAARDLHALGNSLRERVGQFRT